MLGSHYFEPLGANSLSKNTLSTLRIPTQTSRNAGPSRHAALGMSLSLAGLKAGLSRGEIG